MQNNIAKINHPEFVAKRPKLSIVKTGEYQDLLDSLDITIPNHLHIQILQFCYNKNITIYDYDKVQYEHDNDDVLVDSMYHPHFHHLHCRHTNHL